MLSDQEKLTIKVALTRARREGREAEEFRKLARGFNRSEKEVRAYWNEINGDATAPSQKEPAGRLIWTTKQLGQLHSLRAEGKGPAEIARIMGLKTHQVQSKLHSEKKSCSVAKPSTPAEAEPAPVGYDPPVAPPGPPAEPESETGEPKSPSVSEQPSVISDDDPDSFSFAAAAIAKRPFLFAIELTNLMRSLEYSHPPVEMGAMSANQSEGWAECHFTAAGEEIFISLCREERKS